MITCGQGKYRCRRPGCSRCCEQVIGRELRRVATTEIDGPVVPIAIIGRCCDRASELPTAIAAIRHGIRNRVDAYARCTGHDVRMTIWIGIAGRGAGRVTVADAAELRRLDHAAGGAADWIYAVAYGVVAMPTTAGQVDAMISPGRDWSRAGAVIVDRPLEDGVAATTAAIRRAWGRQIPADLAMAVADVRHRGLRIDVGVRRVNSCRCVDVSKDRLGSTLSSPNVDPWSDWVSVIV